MGVLAPPPPKRIEHEREREGEKLEAISITSIHVPLGWDYIGGLHEDHNPRTSNEGCRLVT